MGLVDVAPAVLARRRARQASALIGALAAVSCGRPSGSPSRAPAPLVLLVSWDTTRADALGAWAEESHWGRDLEPALRPAPRTPVADALAARGVRFAWALAHAPTTLSSHTSALSGLDPHGHAVPRNGVPVDASVPLLTERAQAAGYQTLAVVGASVLAKDQGLSRGFDVYDDVMEQRVRRRFERPAAQVVERLLAAVDEVPVDQPIFAFAHFFDAHSPYDTAPAALRAELGVPGYAGPVTGASKNIDWLVIQARKGQLTEADRRQARALYLAEVASMDQALGALLQGLEARGRLRDSLVVLFGDHGETLEERPQQPYGHGLNVQLVDVHVPLIFAGRGALACPPVGHTVRDTVSLSELAPTVAGCLGWPALGTGRDLRAAWGSGLAPRVHFAEATKGPPARDPAAWDNLGFARAASAEAHHLAAAPGEGLQLSHRAPGQPPAVDPAAAEALEAALRAWDAAAPLRRAHQPSAQTAEALEALGYVDPEPSAPPR